MSEKSPPTESELVEFVRSIDVPAPPELHRRIDALVAASAPADRRRRRRLRFGVTGALRSRGDRRGARARQLEAEARG